MRPQQRFINAVREALGLAWLYGPEPPSIYGVAVELPYVDGRDGVALAADATEQRRIDALELELAARRAPRTFVRIGRETAARAAARKSSHGP